METLNKHCHSIFILRHEVSRRLMLELVQNVFAYCIGVQKKKSLFLVLLFCNHSFKNVEIKVFFAGMHIVLKDD